MFPSHTILSPTDFSPCAKHALHYAWSLARQQRARLIVMHVASEESTRIVPGDFLGKVASIVRAFQVLDDTVSVDVQVTNGDPATEILFLAQSVPCQLIVMGMNGNGTNRNAARMGQVCEVVVRSALCPVLAVKTPTSSAVSGTTLGEATLDESGMYVFLDY